ncbi:rna-directed dna polymerase from mobile element jockey-like [Limosa lapponica baueri]|uniref:Rna-directed dna polymerase from mobile element jockey-like n=1 Tax=Limosa lapponica baueri TaxID=1758121 RepID=A0A2I0UL22_LIMLA|nr:rna-directed dna polymerase from mobile element jockey-like [Limosa lapponica baueri]
MADFNYPDICWKNNTVAHVSSISCVTCFITQTLDVPTRNKALLHWLLTNQENLLCNFSVTDSLGCSDHDIVEFGILLSTLKVRTKAQVLDFRRANFSSPRAQLGGTPWEASTEDKGLSECWELFKNALLETQNHFIPFKGNGSKQRKRPPWLNCELLSLLKTKRDVYQKWKSRQMPIENYKGIARECRDTVRKAKAQFKLKLARDVKNYKKGLFRYVSNKHKQKENIGLLLKRRGELVTNNAEKAEVCQHLTSVFTSTVGPQALGTTIQDDAKTDTPSVKEELACKLLQELDPYKSMGPDTIHLKVLRKLTDVVARLVSITSEKSWRLGDIPEDWKKANVTPIYKNGLQEEPGNYRPISLTSVPGKVMEQISCGLSQVK